jgi:hypothetical protein
LISQGISSFFLQCRVNRAVLATNEQILTKAVGKYLTKSSRGTVAGVGVSINSPIDNPFLVGVERFGMFGR